MLNIAAVIAFIGKHTSVPIKFALRKLNRHIKDATMKHGMVITYGLVFQKHVGGNLYIYELLLTV